MAKAVRDLLETFYNVLYKMLLRLCFMRNRGGWSKETGEGREGEN